MVSNWLAAKRARCWSRPASCVVVASTYKKFIRKDQRRGATTDVLAAQTLELPIERGLAGPSLLADTIVRRWQDHQPLTRLSDIYRREQLDVAKSTLCTWHDQLAELVRPLVAAMFEDAYREPYLCVDATGVLVLAKEKCRNGHFWVLVAPEKHVLYGYSRKHDSLAVDALLKDYKGYLVADAHSVYEHLYTDGEVIEVACWAHARGRVAAAARLHTQSRIPKCETPITIAQTPQGPHSPLGLMSNGYAARRFFFACPTDLASASSSAVTPSGPPSAAATFLSTMMVSNERRAFSKYLPRVPRVKS